MIDNETKLKIYILIASRYKNLISEKEQKNISEIRQHCSPYNNFIKKLRDKIAGNLAAYSYKNDFLHIVELVLEYSRTIKNFELLITFWMTFEEIEEIHAANQIDKAILITALLRAFDSESAKVLVTRNNLAYVGFEYNNENYIILPESGSLLAGEDVDKLIKNNEIAYSFSDLIYENYEE